MGLIDKVFSLLFGQGRNIIRETSEVFRENTEASAQRSAMLRRQAIDQHTAEFDVPRGGRFDRFVDGLNRLPRPAMVLGILALFVSAMVDPVWFASRMQGLILVPEPLWWLLGVIVSFYFGARHQVKSHEFQRSLSQTMQRVPEVVDNIEALTHFSPTSATVPEENAALAAWRRDQRSVSMG
ncbi:holin family protein [Falsihalocynthiibacter sp. SS001]|uniref:holin family protein n=1 Tax=Falsihalocynthiibacter sp. SS001 TaxID=3349698 RepID=UPI0036D30409